MACNCKKTKHTPEHSYPGIAIDKADKEHVTEKEVKERTATLNNNPRNN